MTDIAAPSPAEPDRAPFTPAQEARIQDLIAQALAREALTAAHRLASRLVNLASHGPRGFTFDPPIAARPSGAGADEVDQQAAAREDLTRDIASWPALPDGCTWLPSPIHVDGVALSLSADGLISLCVDREGRLSATGRPLLLQLPASPRGGHGA